MKWSVYLFMCISAGASFGAGVVLGITGIIAVKMAWNTRFRLFSFIPVFFALQQIVEGFVWLSLTNSGFHYLQRISIYTFLTFAMIIWPTMVPLSVMLSEKNKKRRKILSFLTWLGAALSCFMLYTLFFREVSAQILSFRVHYNVDYPVELPYLKEIVYLLLTCFPQFISSDKRMKYFSIAVILSYIVTNIYFSENVVSVWCFFAALISITVLYIIWKKEIETKDNRFFVSENNIAVLPQEKQYWSVK